MRSHASAARWDDIDSDPTEDLLNYEVGQVHSHYKEPAHAVWNEVLTRNEWVISEYGSSIHPGYLEGLRALDLPRRVPRVEEINERLQPTGWKTVCVDGYIPTAVYVRLMAASVFPISRRIRNPEHVDYAPMPDLVHDIVGHLPMLFLKEHRDYLRRLASVMTRAVPNELDAELYWVNRRLSELKTDKRSLPASIEAADREVRRVHRSLENKASELTRLGRLYLWTVEFGWIGKPEAPLAYGAALLSSPTELRAVCDGTTPVQPHGVDAMLTDISFSDLQAQYFVADDFAHLDRVLADYEDTMEFRTRFPRTSEVRDIKPVEKRRRHA